MIAKQNLKVKKNIPKKKKNFKKIILISLLKKKKVNVIEKRKQYMLHLAKVSINVIPIMITHG